jgi:SNF2 family DNA or RNA helicase
MVASSVLRSRQDEAPHQQSKTILSNELPKKAALPQLQGPPTKQSPSSETVWWKLDQYQKDAVRFAVKAKYAGLFHEQGTGKTWILGGMIEMLHCPQWQGIIVVPLSNLESTWATFFRNHLPNVPIFTSWDAFIAAPRPRTFLTHYEGLPKTAQRARRLEFSLIAYDEAQRLKARGTLSSRIAAGLSKNADRRVIMSGTPIDREPQDLWAQFRFLAPDVLGKRWKDFESEYLEWDLSQLKERDQKLVHRFKTLKPGSIPWQRALRIVRILAGKPKFNFDKLPQFLERIKPYALRVNLDDVIDLPPLTMHETRVMLRGDQRRMYDDLERTMILRRPDITAPMKATQIWKLQQVAGGYVIDDVGEVHEVGRAKLRALQRIIAQNDRGPIVVWCKYLEEVAALKREIKNAKVECFTGRTRQGSRLGILRSFQMGQIDVLLCQIKTGGVGIDLFRSAVGVLYSYSHSYIDFDQTIKRLRRRGQERAVDIYLLMATNTVDEDIVTALIQKRKVTSTVLDGLKRRQSNGR